MELVKVAYEPLPAVTIEDALAPNAPKVWDNAASNLSVLVERGPREAVEEAFARATHVTKLNLRYPRASANSLEPRAALAYFDAIDRRYTLCSSTQAPYRLREVIPQALGLAESDLRVVAPDVGGAFGMKGQIYPEEALVTWAADRLNRPVKWTGSRCESLASDIHGRDQVTEAELALNGEGRILAMRIAVIINLGAYLCYSGGVAPWNASISYSSTYDVPLIYAVVRAVFTNCGPVGPYRGSGKPEASFVVERLIDKAAHEMQLDAIELRRRNLIAKAAMPYKTFADHIYDSGDFDHVLGKAIELADVSGFAARRRVSETRGLQRGIGIALHCHAAGSQSERMEIRLTPRGLVDLHVGTVASGQGHETTFVQMIAEWLGVPSRHIRVFQGDTGKILFGRGTFAQRTTMTGGSALRLAADEVIRKGSRLAAFMLEAAEEDIEFVPPIFRVKGTDRSVTLQDVVEKSYAGIGLPPEFGVGIDGVGSFPGISTFPNGCMVCEVEVDASTGRVIVASLAAVDDVGTAVNPLILEGQLHGSIAQGLGEATLEEVVYDRQSGQLLTSSFMDYAMPRADNMPMIVSALDGLPTTTNPLGVKGGAEAGNVGAPPAIMNAIVDALWPLGVTDLPIPATPERVWRAIAAAGSKRD
jgi:carbon-monoxide dehydrogenase large subunit